ncbi:MAG TPA: FtsK/SpoIIIE domain-containing protein [Anaerolineaceae bacterium]|nr:FtsK/SpoIIIE domain-containing protein [Anaerolineaceae bacterium]
MNQTPNNTRPSHGIIQNGRKRYVIAIREPWQTPDITVELPSPAAMPSPPASINLLTALLPPLLMVGGMLIFSLVSESRNLTFMLPMLIMGMGFPIANLIGQFSQKKKYKKAIAEREQQYQSVLDEQRNKLREIAAQQRKILEQESPSLHKLIKIALAGGENPRLWWRRMHDEDYLSLRIGTGNAPPSFGIDPPKIHDQNDPLRLLAYNLINEFQEIPDIPLFINLKSAGSTVIVSRSQANLYGFAYRLVLEAIIHHSPEDLQIALISDDIGSSSKWEWLKWAPHTRALYADGAGSGILFTNNDIDAYLEKLQEIYIARKEKETVNHNDQAKRPSYLIFMDDSGKFRQSSIISELAYEGYRFGFYVIFIGEHDTPNTCRSRINITDSGNFRYTESWMAKGLGISCAGVSELTEKKTCEEVSRVLATLETAGANSLYTLPNSVRLSAILGEDPFSPQTIEKNWKNKRKLVFPAGVYVKRQTIDTYMIDFRPDDQGGKDEFHGMLIGTTGSGKSIFLQSLVLATAHQHSPREINFLFMDFKAGAAELKKISDLPHVVGMITDLTPILADRALKALENEAKRRKNIFDKATRNVKDIWDFNSRYPDQELPHLLVVIDEFAEGMKILPDLVDRLVLLGRQGRALGVYFLLANQEVNSAVEQLKPNVGWYIVLKVKRSEEMGLIDRTLPIAPGRGRGYIRVRSEIVEFQGAYSGNPVGGGKLDENEDFSISTVEPDGKLKNVYKNNPARNTEHDRSSSITELELLVSSLQQAAKQMNLKPVRKIYRNPLPEQIPLSEIYEGINLYRQFSNHAWLGDADPEYRLTVPIGMIDIPEDCLQTPLVLNFKQNDGHLWIVGSPGSGKASTIITLLLSLAYTHKPDEIHFYILEYGEGELKVLESLPHTGAVIRLNEQERLERLIRYLEQEVEERSQNENWRDTEKAEIFLVINNFLEISKTYPEQVDALLRFVGKGKGAGVHVIIVTNRSGELPRNISSNISRRIVLQMATRDEYYDALGKNPIPLTARAPGRGYYVADDITECQIAQAKLEDAHETDINDVIRSMKSHWKGAVPFPIRILPNIIPYDAVAPEISTRALQTDNLVAPLGIAYDSLQLNWINLMDDGPTWLILGPPHSGKTNLLLALGYGAFQANPGQLDIIAFVLKRTRNSLDRLTNTNCPINILSAPDQIINACKQLLETPDEQRTKPSLLLIDDIGAATNPGNEEMFQHLNLISSRFGSSNSTFIFAAGIREEMQSMLNSQFLRTLKTGRNGLAFSKDPSDLDWVGVPPNIAIRKTQMMLGRGIFSHRGTPTVVQVPYIDMNARFR